MDRPILFSAPMVRALLDGRKTQTRRVLKPRPLWEEAGHTPGGFSYGAGWSWAGLSCWADAAAFGKQAADFVRIQPGDRLWVREAWARSDQHEWLVAYRSDGECGAWQWDGDGKPLFNRHGKVLDCGRRDGLGEWGLGKFGDRWRSPIHMPRWASRLTLTVTDVRVQRLQDISEEDARAEGVHHAPGDSGFQWAAYPGCTVWYPDAVGAFLFLWASINGAESLEANPWVAAYTFTVERRNIDALPPAGEVR